jgi:hypothetical protein
MNMSMSATTNSTAAPQETLGLLVFHRTTQTAADQILRSGFRDHTARYLTDREWTGVWVSDRALDNSEGASGETLLQIEVAEPFIAAYEWIKEGKPYREWLIPAAVLNKAGKVKLADVAKVREGIPRVPPKEPQKGK